MPSLEERAFTPSKRDSTGTQVFAGAAEDGVAERVGAGGVGAEVVAGGVLDAFGDDESKQWPLDFRTSSTRRMKASALKATSGKHATMCGAEQE
jgi:hypothetical protein